MMRERLETAGDPLADEASGSGILQCPGMAVRTRRHITAESSSLVRRKPCGEWVRSDAPFHPGTLGLRSLCSRLPNCRQSIRLSERQAKFDALLADQPNAYSHGQDG